MAGWVLGLHACVLMPGWEFCTCCMRVCCRIWLERVRSLHELTSQGLSVVLTDLDAIWAKNPLPYLLNAGAGQQQGFDLIVSKGYFPSEVYKNKRVAGACRWDVSQGQKLGVVDKGNAFAARLVNMQHL